jgi:uncharacterized membrane protein
MNYTGIIIGIISFAAIGVFHPIVIKAEYYFSKKIWPLFAAAGILLLAAALFIDHLIVGSGLAIVGLTCVWSIRELFHQEKRVEKGWFPRNPKRDGSGHES